MEKDGHRFFETTVTVKLQYFVVPVWVYSKRLAAIFDNKKEIVPFGFNIAARSEIRIAWPGKADNRVGEKVEAIRDGQVFLPFLVNEQGIVNVRFPTLYEI